MMKKAVKILAFIMAAVTCLLTLGCSKPSEGEVLDAYRQLYPEALTITQYIYGEGLPYDTSAGTDASGYAPVSADSPYQTADELKAAILEVYTETYYESTLKYVLFESIAPNEQGMVGSAPPRYKTYGGKLYVDIDFEAAPVIVCDTNGAYIVEIKAQSAIVGAPRAGLSKDKSCYMALTENGWRFNYRV